MFECEYCDTAFLTEEQLGRHTCREGKRFEELKTKDGIQAFRCYRLWFKARNFIPPTQRTFVTSTHYKAIFRFVKFRKKMAIPDNKIYIEIMASNEIMPCHWYNDDIYRYAMKKFDVEYSPQTHARITITTLEKLSKIFKCEIGEVFDHLRPLDTVNLIQTRNLSPWILLLSPRFKRYLETETNEQERGMICHAMNIKRWKSLLKLKKKYIPKSKEYIQQLNL